MIYKRMHQLALIVATLWSLLSASSVAAHQQKESYTTVLFNPYSGNLEVMHRVYIHDAEHALGLLTDSNEDIISSSSTQLKLAEYLQQRFGLRRPGGEPFILATVGHEVEGKYFWLYQEMPIPAGLRKLEVRMTALQEVWSKQVNQVNFERNGLTRAVRLRSEDGWQPVLLPEP